MNDRFGSPTYAKDLIAAIRTLMLSGTTGTFHLANLGACSRYDIALYMKEVLRKDCAITPVPSSYFAADAERGASEALHSDERLMRPWRDALSEYLRDEWGTGPGHFERTTCRVCESAALRPILDLGVMPLANAFLAKDELSKPESQFPLRLSYCDACSLVQLVDVIDPRLLFLHYDYLTSASAPLVEHFENMADMIVNRFALAKDDLIVEVGSNDGVLLAHIKDRVRVLGIDPAEEAASLAAQKGVETIIEFLDPAVVVSVVEKHGHARVVIANNVMAHMDNVRETFSSIRALLAPGGRFVFEVHWVGNLIGEGGFDQIYHEHLCYYSLHALRELLKRTGFSLEDAELVPVHGASLRVYAYNGSTEMLKGAKEILAAEKRDGINTYGAYESFAGRVQNIKRDLLDLLQRLRREHRTVAGYGAPAKGNTLLNYCGIDTDLLPFISDSTPFKQGKYTPGTHIPIVDPEKLRSNRPDYVLLLAWNYGDSILKKEQSLRDAGTVFIFPVPKVRTV